MAVQTVTLELPTAFYQQLKRRADADRRSVEEQLLSVVATVAPTLNDLPQDIEDSLAQLSLLDDEALWQAGRVRVSADAGQRAEDLHAKRRHEGLTDEETRELTRLLQQSERIMLVRAQAAATLKQRGHDVSGLLTKKP